MNIPSQFTTEQVVTAAHSARQMGSGELDVLATPAMIALMEHAAMHAVAEQLPEGYTTVGSEMHTTHLHPTPLGVTIRAVATLTAEEGRKLTFRIEAYDAQGLIGEGTHIRFVVDKARFMAKLPQ